MTPSFKALITAEIDNAADSTESLMDYLKTVEMAPDENVKRNRLVACILTVVASVPFFVVPVVPIGGSYSQTYPGCSFIDCPAPFKVLSHWSAVASLSYHLLGCGALYDSAVDNVLNQTTNLGLGGLAPFRNTSTPVEWYCGPTYGSH